MGAHAAGTSAAGGPLSQRSWGGYHTAKQGGAAARPPLFPSGSLAAHTPPTQPPAQPPAPTPGGGGPAPEGACASGTGVADALSSSCPSGGVGTCAGGAAAKRKKVATLSQLDEFRLQFDEIDTAVARLEAAPARDELAQLEARLDRLQCHGVDSLVTSELSPSSKELARSMRRELTRRAEQMHCRMDVLFRDILGNRSIAARPGLHGETAPMI